VNIHIKTATSPPYFDYWGGKAVSVPARIILFQPRSWPAASYAWASDCFPPE
jgi:hypothetical protein